MADPTTLICDWNGGDAIVQDEPTIIELNQARSEVSVHFSGYSVPVLGHQVRALSAERLPALFGNDMITFRYDGPDGLYLNARGAFSINRLTGAFVNIHSNNSWDCTAAPK